MNTITRNTAKNDVFDLLKKAIFLFLTLGMSLTVSAEPPDPCDTPLIFADMEVDAGWGVFSGGGLTGGFELAEEGSVAPLNGGTWAAFLDVNTFGGSGFGGFFRTFPLDLTGMTHFNFWINPAAGQEYVIEVNLQEDDNNDNDVQFANPADDDEFRYYLYVAPFGTRNAQAISGEGWQLVSIPLADFDDNNSHFQGNDVFDPFLSGNGQLINVVFTVSLPAGVAVKFATDNWFFSCEDVFCNSLKTLSKNISDKLNGAGYPAGAASDISAAIGDLDAAVADCEGNDVQEAYKDLEDAMKELMDAAKDGADVSEEIGALIALVRGELIRGYSEAYSSYGFNQQYDNYIDKGQNFMVSADQKNADGEYNLAIRRWTSARKELERAIHLGTALSTNLAEVAERARSNVEGLIANGGYSSDANAHLQDASDALLDAAISIAAGEIFDGFGDLRDAAEALMDAEEDGAAAPIAINGVINAARSLAEFYINEAQAYAGNPQTDANLAKAQADMSDAIDEIIDGRPDRAVKEYRDAWSDARVALEHGRGLRKVDDEVTTSLTPETFSLAQNYPNPFNPSTNIAFQIGNPAFVELKVYDISGRLVKTLVNENRAAGNYTEQWDGSNSIGQKVGSGIYFYQIKAGEFQQIKKMMLVK